MLLDQVTRRDFIKVGSAAGLAAGLGMHVMAGNAEPAGEKKLRVAFIGTGGRGQSLLGDTLGLVAKPEGGNARENLEVVVICDTTPANLKRGLDMVEEKTGKRPEGIGDAPYDYRKVLTRQDLDCVVLATPCYWHTTMYLDCLKHGKHFYGEKPMSITAGELKEIQSVRQQHREVVMQIGTQWGSHEQRRNIIKKVQQGLIGDLWDGRFARKNGMDGFQGWFTDRTKSGDWMLEQAVHELNLMWWVTQQHPVSCMAVGRSGIIPGRDTTSFYTALLQYGKPYENLVIRYTHTFIEVREFDTGGSWGFKFIGSKGAVDLMDASARFREKPAEGEITIKGEGAEGDTPEHLLNFFQAVREGKPEVAHCGLENGVGSTLIGLMIRQSIEQKRSVTVEETLADPRKSPVPAA
jgi:predicted dehydrogenase